MARRRATSLGLGSRCRRPRRGSSRDRERQRVRGARASGWPACRRRWVNVPGARRRRLRRVPRGARSRPCVGCGRPRSSPSSPSPRRSSSCRSPGRSSSRPTRGRTGATAGSARTATTRTSSRRPRCRATRPCPRWAPTGARRRRCTAPRSPWPPSRSPSPRARPADAAAWIFKASSRRSRRSRARPWPRRLARRRALAVAFVGWNPVLAVHLAGGGHNDAWVAALLAAALGLSARRRLDAAGVAWSLAILVKWMPVVFLVLRAIEARATGRPIRHAGFAATTVVVLGLATWRYGLDWVRALEPLAANASRRTSYALPSRLESAGVPEVVALGLAGTALAGRARAPRARGAAGTRALARSLLPSPADNAVPGRLVPRLAGRPRGRGRRRPLRPDPHAGPDGVSPAAGDPALIRAEAHRRWRTRIPSAANIVRNRPVAWSRASAAAKRRGSSARSR